MINNMLTYKEIADGIKERYKFINVSHSLSYNKIQTIFGVIITLTNEQIKLINSINKSNMNIEHLKIKAELIVQNSNPIRFGAASKISCDFSKNPIQIYGSPDAIVVFLDLIFNQ